MKIKMPPFRPLPTLIGVFFFLDLLLNFDYPANHLFSWRLLLPSMDVWLLLLLLAMAAWWGRRPVFWTGLTVWAFFLVLRLYRIGETIVPMYFNRPFTLYIDSGYLFDLYDLLKTSAQKGDFLQLAVIALTVTIGVIASSGVALRAAAKAFSNNRVRNPFLGVSVIALGVALTIKAGGPKPPVMMRLGREILSIRDQQLKEQVFLTKLKQIAQKRSIGPAPLKGLKGADVLLFLVESYGRTVFFRPRYRKAMEATMSNFAKILKQHGFKAVSSYLVSPTYGGSSWLAHATLESGLRVKNNLEDAALLHSSLPPLATYFRKSGYRTVSVMPGTRFPFPQGAYFDYKQVYYAPNFDYRGPTFGWAPMSDQFVLDWVRRHEFTRHNRSIFVRYVLISTHAAFNIQPTFVADWNLIGDGSIYSHIPSVHYPIYWPDLTNAGDAYLRSLDYEFTTIGDYLARYVDPHALILIVGDHQPNLQLTDVNEPWSVPIHVISGDSHLLEPFCKRGYTPGLIPDKPPPHAGMETFLPGFLQDFK